MTNEHKIAVIEKIKEMSGNSMNVPLDFFSLKNQIPNLDDNDINDVLLYLESKGLIDKCNKTQYLGCALIKNFYITSDFIDNYS